MQIFKRFIIIYFISFFSLSISFAKLVADEENEIKASIKHFKEGMNTHNRELIQNSTTINFYKSLTKEKLLERLFNKTKKKKSDPIEISITDSKIIPGYIIAKVKNLKNNHTEHFKILKTSKGYKIDSEIHLDE